MGLVEDFLASALVRRVRQEWESQDKDTIPNPLGGEDIHYNPLRDVPLVGGLINRTVNAPLHAVGIANEAAGQVAKTAFGAAVLAAAAGQRAIGDDNSEAGRDAARILAEGFDHPGRALETARNSEDDLVSYLAGAGEIAANPLNYTAGIARAGMGLAAGAPRLGNAIAQVGRAGEAINQAQMLPVAAIFPSARRAILDTMFPKQGTSEAIRTAVTPNYRESVAAMQAAREVLTTPGERATGKEGGVPQRTLVRLADKLKGYGPTEIEGLPDTPSAPLTPIEEAANAATDQGATVPPTATLPERDGGANPLATAKVPALDRLRSLLLSGDEGRGMVYPPNDPAFYTRRTGIPAEEVPGLLRQLETEGIIGRDLDGGMMLRQGDRRQAMPTVADETLPPEAITPEQEAAAAADWYSPPQTDPAQAAATAPELPASSLADLSDDEIMTLVEVGYGSDQGVTNALAKRKDPMLLAGRAIERITTDRRKLAVLAETHPDLAEKLAYLDLPGETRPPTPAVLPLGGDIAAGGDKIVSPRIAPTTIGAVAGAGTGAAVGALADEDDRLGGAARGATVGALAGGNLGAISPEIRQFATRVAPQVTQSLEGSWLDPEMIGDILTVMKREQATHGNDAGNVRGLKDTWDAFWQQWRSQAVNTPKQFSTDAASRKLVMETIAKQEFPGYDDQAIRDWQRLLSAERVSQTSSLNNPLVQKYVALGQQDLLQNLEDIYGLDFTTATNQADKRFGPVGRAVAGAVRGTFDGARTFNPLMPLVGAARGYLDTAVAAGIQHGNGIQHDAARYAMGDLALDRDIPARAAAFLAELKARGVDTTALEARGGWFSGDEVAAIAGTKSGQDWHNIVEGVIRAEGDRIAFLNGDFRDKLDPKYTGTVTRGDRIAGTVEKAVGKYVPFARWQIRYAPVLAEIATRHPRAAALVAAQIVHGTEQAEDDGLRPYEANTIPISTETPVAGALARALLGGQQGTVRVDPLGLLVPFGAEALMGDESGGKKTAYQHLTGALGRVGFSPAPAIGMTAYALGQDWKSPGALSRTAGIEKVAGLIPGMPELPGPQAAIDLFRSIAEPAIRNAGGMTAGRTSEYDPIGRRYAELVLAKTGKPLADPSNGRYLETMGEGDPLYDRAKREVLASGAAKNIASLGNPLGTTTQGANNQAARAAKAAQPHSYEAIAAASPGDADRMRAENDRYAQANPAANTYAIDSKEEGREELIDRWEKAHVKLKRAAKDEYDRRRATYIATLK